MGQRDYAQIAEGYAQDVVCGRIAACKWVKLACQRHIQDRKREKTKGFPFRFDAVAASRPCRFMELFPHVRGPLGGQNIRLEPWQCFIVCSVFGWVHKETGFRRFTVVYVEVPRGNAKSTLLALVCLYMLSATGEAGAEVYSAATTRDQAKVIFGIAQPMARQRPQFLKHYGVTVKEHNIHQLRTVSKFEPLSADAHTLDGLNIYMAAVDELHAHRTRHVYDVLKTGIGKRKQPILWSITTAGTDRSGVCYEVRQQCGKILEGVWKDENFFGLIYTIDEKDDWTQPETWRKANPNWGISVEPPIFEQSAREAMQMASKQPAFLTKHLDIWVNADVAAMDMLAWGRVAKPWLKLEDFAGRECYLGMDLASKWDLASLAILFPNAFEIVLKAAEERAPRAEYEKLLAMKEQGRDEGHYALFTKNYCPEATVQGSANSQYQGWQRSGHLIATPNNTTDYYRIGDDVRELARGFAVQEVPYDPYNAQMLVTQLLGEGLPMVELSATVEHYSFPMKTLLALPLDGKLHHAGDPLLTWCVSNVVCHVDAKDNIYPRKERDENKIDPFVAAIMAMNRHLASDGPSVYEERGIIAV